MFLRTVWQYARNGNRMRRNSPRIARLNFEHLEMREMLSATAPTVTDVAVSSTNWSSDFYEYLADPIHGEIGYVIPVGSSDQSLPLPWSNIDQIRIVFSEDVDVDAADLSLSGINNIDYQVEKFLYDARSHVATWSLENPILADRLMIDLDADGIDPVVDLDGNILDGDWIDNVTSGNSGDGSAGGDFQFSFNTLPADVDQNEYVTYFDLVFMYARDGQTTLDANYSALHDVDGSGMINIMDWTNVITYFGSTVPAGQPAGATNDAPTTAGIASVLLDNAAVDEAISLFDAFEDAEDLDSQLTYEIIGNTNPSMLDTLSINQATGVLTLSAAENVSGRTTITVRATDSQGLSTETSIGADSDYTNLPPVIVSYSAEQFPGNTWVFTGVVVDPDDDVEGWVLEFGGVFETRATVNKNGYFEFAVILDEEEWGYEWVQAEDPHGLKSNAPQRLIGLT